MSVTDLANRYIIASELGVRYDPPTKPKPQRAPTQSEPTFVQTLVADLRAAVRAELRQNQCIPGRPETWPDHMTPKQASAYCQVTVQTLRNWREQGLKCEIRGRVVRYAKVDLDSWMRGDHVVKNVDDMADQIWKREQARRRG